ncbi:MAG: transposase [Nanoarchaeota archaeon]
MPVKHFIGVDVSKADFYACFNEADIPKQYPNTQAGINHLIRALKQKGCTPNDTKIGVESTGPYYYRLSFQCRDNGYSVNIINPLITSGHTKATVRKTKTDKKDASVIRHVLTQGHGYPFVETK